MPSMMVQRVQQGAATCATCAASPTGATCAASATCIAKATSAIDDGACAMGAAGDATFYRFFELHPIGLVIPMMSERLGICCALISFSFVKPKVMTPSA